MKSIEELEVKGNCIIRIVGQPCWQVPSNTPGHMPHKICWNADKGLWECSCRNGEEMKARGLSAKCYAVNAVMASVLANKDATKPVAAPTRVNRSTLNRPEIRMENGIPMR